MKRGRALCAALAAALFESSLLVPPARAADQPGAARDASPPPGTTAPELDIGGLADAAAEAQLQVRRGSSMTARARLEQVEQGVKVLVEVEGAPPGNKAVHVHERGDCSDIAGKSMGEHFAPRGEPHGLPDSARHHIGDLGNIQIGEDGRGRLEILAAEANLEEQDPLSLLDKAIVIHEAADEGTQPAGDAGSPMACGVIRAV